MQALRVLPAIMVLVAIALGSPRPSLHQGEVDRVVPEQAPEGTLLSMLQHANQLIQRSAQSRSDTVSSAKVQLKENLQHEEENQIAKLDKHAKDTEASISKVLAKAKAAKDQASKLMDSHHDDATVTAAKKEAQAIKEKAHEAAKQEVEEAKDEAKQKVAAVAAMKAQAQTEADGKLQKASADANEMMLAVQTHESAAKQQTQQKAEELAKKTADEAAAATEKAATAMAKEKGLEEEVNTRLEKAKALEAAARKEKEDAEESEARQEKTYKVNKAFLDQEKKAGDEALRKAQDLMKQAGVLPGASAPNQDDSENDGGDNN